VPIIRGETSRGLHVRALVEAIVYMLEAMPPTPSHRRVALRNHLSALLRAYPELDNATDLAQAVAEMDDEALQDDP